MSRKQERTYRRNESKQGPHSRYQSRPNCIGHDAVDHRVRPAEIELGFTTTEEDDKRNGKSSIAHNGYCELGLDC